MPFKFDPNLTPIGLWITLEGWSFWELFRGKLFSSRTTTEIPLSNARISVLWGRCRVLSSHLTVYSLMEWLSIRYKYLLLDCVNDIITLWLLKDYTRVTLAYNHPSSRRTLPDGKVLRKIRFITGRNMYRIHWKMPAWSMWTALITQLPISKAETAWPVYVSWMRRTYRTGPHRSLHAWSASSSLTSAAIRRQRKVFILSNSSNLK